MLCKTIVHNWWTEFIYLYFLYSKANSHYVQKLRAHSTYELGQEVGEVINLVQRSIISTVLRDSGKIWKSSRLPDLVCWLQFVHSLTFEVLPVQEWAGVLYGCDVCDLCGADLVVLCLFLVYLVWYEGWYDCCSKTVSGHLCYCLGECWSTTGVEHVQVVQNLDMTYRKELDFMSMWIYCNGERKFHNKHITAYLN